MVDAQAREGVRGCVASHPPVFEPHVARGVVARIRNEDEMRERVVSQGGAPRDEALVGIVRHDVARHDEKG